MLIWTLPCQNVISLLLAATPTRFVSRPLRDRPRRQALQLGQGPGRHEEVLLARDACRCPGRSRMAMRYESVATMRMDPSTRDTSTPVSSGRPSSWEAARTTWRTASPSAVSDSCVVGSLVLPTGGNSTTGYVWSLNVERAARDRDVVTLVGERHRSGLEPAHDVGRQAAPE